MDYTAICYNSSGAHITTIQGSCGDTQKNLLTSLRQSVAGLEGLHLVEVSAKGKTSVVFTEDYLFPERHCGGKYTEMWVKMDKGLISQTEFDTWFDAHCGHCHYMSEICMFGEDGPKH